MRREKTEATIAVIRMNNEGRRRKPKKRWLDMIEGNIRATGMCVEYVKDQDKWKSRTKVANPN